MTPIEGQCETEECDWPMLQTKQRTNNTLKCVKKHGINKIVEESIKIKL